MNKETYLTMLAIFASMSNQFRTKAVTRATMRMTLTQGRNACTIIFNRDTKKFIVIGSEKNKLRYKQMQKEINDKFKELRTQNILDNTLPTELGSRPESTW